MTMNVTAVRAFAAIAVVICVCPSKMSSQPSELQPSKSIEVFTTPDTTAIPYRIPAIAAPADGSLIAVADYRHSRSDIGVMVSNSGYINDGKIDICCRISPDCGKNWGEIFTIIQGKGTNSPDAFNTGFGDPAIVADYDSNEVLMITCAGNVSFFGGTRNNHQGIAIFRSIDGGRTWSQPVDLAESFYEQLDHSARGPVKAMFIGSGKIHQSRHVKVDKYFRLYCAAVMRDVNNIRCNYIYYSDDFGRSWKLLGDPDTPPITQNGDEPKAEEMPDGSVVISSRIRGGRAYNIYTFSDIATASGNWDEMAVSDVSNRGTIAQENATNGEILILPVTRVSDGKPTWIALVSVPFGPGRSNVGIYYKELNSKEDYSSPEVFAKDWNGRYQVSDCGSAYSTMAQQANGLIAFFYEEDTYNCVSGGGFTLIYKPLSISDITNGLYNAVTQPAK